MSTENINDQLKVVYQTYLDSIYAKFWPDGVSAPLLMHVFPEYATMERKILIVGQETNSWGKMNADKSRTVADLQVMYEGFALGKQTRMEDGKKLRTLSSAFWNFSRSLFHKMNPEVSRMTNGFLWTNISKIDFNSKTPPEAIQEQNEKGFHLLKTEIEIVKPDIVVFLTNIKYDAWIDEVFQILPSEEDHIMANGFLKKIKTTDHSLPELTFQTKHPRTLKGSLKKGIPNKYYEVLEKIAEMSPLQSQSPLMTIDDYHNCQDN